LPGRTDGKGDVFAIVFTVRSFSLFVFFCCCPQPFSDAKWAKRFGSETPRLGANIKGAKHPLFGRIIVLVYSLLETANVQILLMAGLN